MHRLRSLRWVATLFVIVVSAAMIASYLFATTVDAYVVAKRVIEEDSVIRSHIPDVHAYRLAFLDGYHYSMFGTDATAEYRFIVSGGSQRGTVDLALERHAGRWSLTRGTLVIDEKQPIDLQPRQLP